MSPLPYPVPIVTALSLPAAPAASFRLAQRACALERAATEGPAQPVLRGKNVGLLCDDPSQPAALLVLRAATDLGAQVALVKPSFALIPAADSLLPTARMLGRLYDAIVCVALPPALPPLLRQAAGVPVLDESAVALEGEPPCDGGFIWQAALIDSLN